MKEKKMSTSSKILVGLCLLVIVGIAVYYLIKGVPYLLQTPVNRLTVQETGLLLPEDFDTGLPHADRISCGNYDKEEVISYFDEVVLASEFAGSKPILKWTVPVLYHISGTPTEEDRATLENLIARINQIPGFPGLTETQNRDESNFRIHFYEDDEYAAFSKKYGFANTDGFAFCWDGDGSILQTIIGFRLGTTQSRRNSVILEETIQGIGLLADSFRYPDSVVYEGVKELTQPKDLDWILVRALYSPAVFHEQECGICNAILRYYLLQP
ncbi:MAG: DUF2927 domain-containing protein [Lachnospiraceae bacterium]|nr:DUF2927 domain-containing protein [Lachnospiraceae bacterium]